MKKLIIALVVAVSCAARAHAAAAVSPVLDTPAGSRVSASAAQSLAFIGAQVYRIEVATGADTPVQLLTGAGMLYAINCGSGTSSGYELSFDSNTTSGITYATTGKALHAPVYSPGQVSAASNVGTLNIADAPAQFSSGLVVLTHGAAISCYIRARLNTGANPGP